LIICVRSSAYYKRTTSLWCRWRCQKGKWWYQFSQRI